MATTFFTHGAANVDEFLSSTLSEYRTGLTDQIYTGMPLTNWLLQKGRIKQGHGYSYVTGVRYAKNATAGFISATGQVSVSPTDNTTSVQYRYQTLASSIVLTDEEVEANTEEYQIYNLAEAKKEDAVLSGKDAMSTALFNATVPANTIESVDTIIAATGAIGDQSALAWWQATSTASGSFANVGLTDMTALYNTISKSLTDVPDLIVTTQAIYQFYETAARAQFRFDMIGDGKVVDLGVGKGGLKFKGATMFFDENEISGRLHIMNTNYFYLVVTRNFEVGPFVRPANQLLKIALLSWRGALVTDRRASQGRLTGVTA